MNYESMSQHDDDEYCVVMMMAMMSIMMINDGDEDHDVNMTSTVRVHVPVFGRYQFFGTSEHYRTAHRNLLSWWMNCNYTACCWFPTSSNILILPSQFWQIRFKSYWLHCSKCRRLVLLWYMYIIMAMMMMMMTINW